MTSVQKKWLYSALIMLIFIFAFGIRVYHLSEKKGFHGDEFYSIVLVDYKDVGWESRPLDGEYTGAELKNMIFNMDKSASEMTDAYRFLNSLPIPESRKDLVFDLFRLWDDNRDTPHTNFYYTLLRLSLEGINTDDRAEFESQCIFRAGALNLILFTISFFAFFVLLNLIIKDKTLILLGLIVASFNSLDISISLLFRDYVLQGLFFVVFTAYLIWTSNKIKLGEYKDSWQNLLIFALPLSLMLLTGYYSFVYAFFLGFLFLAFPLRRYKRLDLSLYFFVGSIIAVLYDLLFYNNFMAGFYSYRTLESLGTGGGFFSKDSLFIIFDVLSKNIFYTSALILLIFILIYKLIKKESFGAIKEYGWVVLSAFLFCFIIILISPSKSVHYVAPSMFIISLVYPLLLSSIKSLLFKRIASLLISFIFIFIAIKGDNILYKYEIRRTHSYILEKNGYLDKYDSIYICMSSPVSYPPSLANFEDDQKYIVCNNVKLLLEKTKDGNCLVFYKGGFDPDIDNSLLDKNLDLTEHGFELLPSKGLIFSVYRK